MTASLNDPSDSLRTSSSAKSEFHPRVLLSFDVEEHHRIEAAAGLEISSELKHSYGQRARTVTRWLLERLEERCIKATFFVVGQFAEHNPGLVREIHGAGHEVASHGWDHRRIIAMTPDELRYDVQRSVDLLQQIIGERVWGYRAPTFSIVRQNAWAIDILADFGLLYDSSIYPIRHDRYGVPGAPRSPFVAVGPKGNRILELPPATLQISRATIPVGGGGYFRLFPPAIVRFGIHQMFANVLPPVVTLYFHPWEFDCDQPRLPLKPLSRFRTYVGIGCARERLIALMNRYQFSRAVDLVRDLENGCQFAIPQVWFGAQ